MTGRKGCEWSAIGVVLLETLWIAGPAWGRWSPAGDRNLSVVGEYRTENYFRITHGPNDVSSQRNELKLEVEYDNLLKRLGVPASGPRGNLYVQLRPWYDTVFDFESSGTGGNRILRRNWQHNLDWQIEEQDPFLREAYLDVNWFNFYGRLGRQIIAWGKSDGVFMLDLINPFNFRNPFIFEEEDIKIPLWMLNLNYRVGINGTIQVLWIPRYVRATYPGFYPEETVGGAAVAVEGRPTGSERLRHDFEFNTITFANEFYQLVGLPVIVDRPANNLDNSMAALRWSHVLGDVNYTLNYFYTWTSFMFDYPNTGDFLTVTQVARRPGRLHIVGASWDYALKWMPAPFTDIAWRGEAAYLVDDLFVNADETSPRFFLPETTDHFGLMMGFDNTYTIDVAPWVSRTYLDPIWFVSVQYWQDWILDPIRAKNAYYDTGAGTPNINVDPVGRGRRDDLKSQITLFILKDILPGDVLHWEFFVLYGISFDDWWLRVRSRYEVTDSLNVAVGFNEFLGGRFDPFGQFHDRSHLWLELRWALI